MIEPKEISGPNASLPSVGGGYVQPGEPLAPPETRGLAEAFQLFNRVSEELADAYTGLQEQVAQLTTELAIANGRLRQEYEEKAALSQRLAGLLDALPAGVAVLDEMGIIRQTNPAVEAMLGAGLEGCVWSDVASYRLHASGTPAEWLNSPHVDARRLAITKQELGGSSGSIVLIHDVTEAHAMKVQAARHERLAAMGEMAAGFAHQLRTPLSAALLFASHVANGQLGEAERARVAGKTLERLQHLEHLVQDMLRFARGEAGQSEAIEISTLMTELAQIAEPLARQRDIRFTVMNNAVNTVVIGDRKALSGALINLIENAFDACEVEGEVSLYSVANQDRICLEVCDDGRGMDAATQARLFEPFFTTRAEGTGLGLAIARGVARSHRGEIDVESTLGGGTVFRFWLPIADFRPDMRVDGNGEHPEVAHEKQLEKRRAVCRN